MDMINNVIDWRYLAGFFDGEGCIYFVDKNQISGRKVRHVMVHISQADFQSQVIFEISKFLKKNVIEHRIVSYLKPKSAKWGNQSKSIRLIITDLENVKYFLESIKPFSIVKKKKLEEGLKFIGERIKDGTKRRNYSLREKLKIIKWLKAGKTYKKIILLLGRNNTNIIHQLKKELKNGTFYENNKAYLGQ